jgi:putative tryptophan/tyrosine transport system substrate-binding protein
LVTDGRNVRMDLRWGGGDTNRASALAQGLVGSRRDIILTASSPTTAAVQRETRTIPIVFANVTDPVAQHIVARLDRGCGDENSNVLSASAERDFEAVFADLARLRPAHS